MVTEDGRAAGAHAQLGGAGARAIWIASLVIAVATALMLWGLNAALIRAALGEPGVLRRFLANVPAVAVAAASGATASVAWAAWGLRRAHRRVPGRAGVLRHPLAAPVVGGLVGLVGGIGISWFAAAPAAGPARDLVADALRDAAILAAGFVLATALVSDLSTALATRLADRPPRHHTLGLGFAILLLNSILAAAAVAAIALARADILRQ